MAMVIPCDFANYREPKAGAVGTPRDERLEQALAQILGDAGAGVGHPQQQAIVAPACVHGDRRRPVCSEWR